MKRKKYIILLVMCLVIILGMLLGVYVLKKHNSNKSDDVELSDSISTNGVEYTDQGILYFSGDYVRFCNNETKQDGLICVDQSCKHDNSRTSSCGAYISAGICSGIAKRGQYLYYIADTSDGELGNCSLYSENLEGKNRNKIADLIQMDYIFDVIYHKSDIYIAYLQSDYEGDGGDTLGIYVFNLDSGNGKVLYSLQEEGFSFDGMALGQDCIYLSYVYSNASSSDILKHSKDKKYEEKHRVSVIKGLDMSTGEEKVSFDGYGSGSTLVYASGKVFYNKNNSTYYYDEEIKNSKKISEKELLPVYSSSNTNVYYTGYDNQSKKCIYYRYDILNQKLYKIGQGTFYVGAVLDQQTYVQINNQTGDSNYGVIDTDQFLAGEFSDLTVYESLWDEE